MKRTTVRTSSIHGRGLFATVPIKKGVVIGIFKGKIHKKINWGEKDALSHPYWVEVAKNTWIDPLPPYRFINHSCNPSAGIKGRITIIALHDLKAGDEITLDYSTIESDSRWNMRCVCYESNCRKTVRSIQHLSKKQFAKYLPYMSTYFKRLYTKEHLDNKNRARMPRV